MVFRTLIVFSAAKRIPMIKFRSGGSVMSSGTSQPQSVSTTVNKSKPKAKSQNPKQSGTAVEYWQLPRRFQRRPIDEDEIEYINRGGPDKL